MQEFHKYVPMIEYEKDVYVPSIDKSVQVAAGSAHIIQFAGDQKNSCSCKRGTVGQSECCYSFRKTDGTCSRSC